MVFSSNFFLFYFLPISIIAYFLFKKSNLVILILSFVFYFWSEQELILIMLLSATIDYLCGQKIFKYIEDRKDLAKKFLFVSIFTNLGLLIYFKYCNFFINEFNQIWLTLFNSKLNLIQANIIFPLGISFYTFQSMSYSIDIYNKRVKPTNSLIDFFTFVTMFPQLIAGPIVRYKEIEKDLKYRNINSELFAQGVERFLIGLIKKVLIANNIFIIFEFYTQGFELNIIEAWITVLSFAIYLYFDFSAYSDMAIGLGKILGFNFPENFNYPFASVSLQEYWRRWHMTLSRWLKDYLYLNLSQGGKLKASFNVFIVFFLCGVWHGSSWGFIVWGVFNGIIIALEKEYYIKYIEKLPHLVQVFYAFLMFTLGVFLIGMPELNEGLAIMARLLAISSFNLGDLTFFSLFEYQIYILLIALFFAFPRHKFLDPIIKKIYFLKRPALILCFIYVIAEINATTYKPFFYFRF